MKRLIRLGLNLLFPPRCAGCARRGDWLCAACRQALQPVRPPICPICGDRAAEGAICPRCRATPPAFDRVISAYQHTGPLRQAVHRFKYEGQRALANPLGQLLVAALPAGHVQVDTVMPVPLHHQRERERGYNQSALLAGTVAEHLGAALMPGLVRTRATPPQVGRSALDRRTNMSGAFAWTGPPLANRRVLLVDDVCTTGATLDACARALREAGPEAVFGLTLARG